MYTKLHRRPPAEADLQRYFGVTPPSIHNMILTLERRGLITRTPGRALSIYSHDTLLNLIKVLAYFSAFLLAAYVFDSGKRKSTLVVVLMVLGGSEAAY